MGRKQRKVIEETPTTKTVLNFGNFVVDLYYGEQIFRCPPNKRVTVPLDINIPIGVTLMELKK